MSWSTPTISDLVELLMSSFFLQDIEIGNPCPISVPPPVRPLILGCITCDPSMYHLRIPLLYTLSMKGRYLVPLK